MTKIKTYRDLIIWQKSMDLVAAIYKITKTFPKDETYGLITQMRRCAVSIPSNISEGYGRNSSSDYVCFLHIAMGSLYELQTQLEISLNLNYLEAKGFKKFFESSREVERMMSSMIRKISTKGTD